MSALSRLASLLIAALVLAGCAVAVEEDALGDLVGDGGDGGAVELQEGDGEPTTEPPAEGQDLEVPLEIVEGGEGSVLAFVPVMINGEGPFNFALDTGASNSVVDEGVAAELGLEVVGDPAGVQGVTGGTEADIVQVEDWRTGEVDLGARPLISLDLDSGGPTGPGIQGLIGSDVLSAFGAITVDYESGVLVLRPRAVVEG
jgi:hypothetical protein